jgi:hypothetical protein
MRREQAARSGKIAVTKISIPEVRFAKVGTGEGASAEISATQLQPEKSSPSHFIPLRSTPMWESNAYDETSATRKVIE